MRVSSPLRAQAPWAVGLQQHRSPRQEELGSNVQLGGQNQSPSETVREDLGMRILETCGVTRAQIKMSKEIKQT